MSWWRRIVSRQRLYGELWEEIRSHIEERVEELVARGMSQRDAEAAARREFGNMTKIEEDSRSVWQWPGLETFLLDVRYGLRVLRQAPGFAAVAILTLALGIGANASIFSLVSTVLLRPMPYRDGAKLVWVSTEIPSQRANIVMESDYFAWRRSNRVFDDVAAYDPGDSSTITGGKSPEQVQAGHATFNFLDVLGVTPRMGRGFKPDEDRPGAAGVVLLTDAIWKRHFSSDEGILGRPITLDGKQYTVIGILPPGFEFLDNNKVDVITPAALEHYEVAIDKPMRIVNVVGRLRDGVSPAAATADVDGINEQILKKYPPMFAQMLKGARARVVPVRDRLVGNVRPALLVLLGAVGCVLLIACANVANLQMARAVSREKDIAIRGALGAGPWRLVRQLLTENILIALAGGIGGLIFAAWLLGVVRLWGPTDIPHLALARLDWRVMLFAVALSLLTGVLFGLSPAFAAFRVPVIESLRFSGSREGASTKIRRPHSVLMVAELAIALVLFVGAGLLIRSFAQLTAVPAGFDGRGVLTAHVSLPMAVYQTREQRVAFFRQLDEKLGAIPGVTTAGLATILPLQGANWGTLIQIEGSARETMANGPGTEMAEVTPGYFLALRIRLIEGRLLDARDADGTTRALVANETFVRRHFAGQDAVGKRLKFGDAGDWWTLVGVVGDTKQHGLAAATEPELFIPLARWNAPQICLVLRTQNEAMGMVAAVRSVVTELDRNLPLFDVETMNELLAREVAAQRFNAAMLTGFAAFALLLAALGIYGVMAYAVGQQTHEIGVRMALGAAPRDVLRMILVRGLGLAVVGLSLGLGASMLLTRFMRTLLFGVRPGDPLTFAGVTAVLLLVCWLACWLPARRAMLVDPMVALRHE